MAQINQTNSKVIGIDHVKQLVDKSQEILEKNFPYLLNQVNFIKSDGSNGYSPGAPYDAIHIGGVVTKVPQTILDQLKIGGRLIAPIIHDQNFSKLTIIDKLPNGLLERKPIFIELSERLS